jgi:hydroxycarboxylate dehydrogenase B
MATSTSRSDSLFAHDALTRAIAAIIAAGGSSEREAQQVASNLVLANLTGHDSHGVGMVPRYIDALREGGLFVNREPAVVTDAGALLALNGQAGYGQSIGAAAMSLAIERARTHGCCVMALANSHHLGRIGHWAEMAVAAGFVSLHFVNVLARPIVAAYGGADGRFGTNPVCIGVPLNGEPPLILDFATSTVAQGKMRVAHNKGELVAEGLLIDQHGRPTRDPGVVVVEPVGALTPFGLHKGYGLALVCELLGGALTGGGTWHQKHTGARRVLNGMLTVLIDPARLGTADVFGEETRAFLDWLRAGPTAPGFDRVRIAGEPERATRTARERDGIPIDRNTWSEILAAAEKLGLAAGSIETLATAAQ